MADAVKNAKSPTPSSTDSCADSNCNIRAVG